MKALTFIKKNPWEKSDRDWVKKIMQEDNTTSWLFPQDLYQHIQLFNAFLSKLYVWHDRLPDQQTYDNLPFINLFLTKSS